MKITITGASGFVGQNLINYLEKDYDLIPLRTRYNQN
jgi:nucleoside-diphosphate-sugar epimerase